MLKLADWNDWDQVLRIGYRHAKMYEHIQPYPIQQEKVNRLLEITLNTPNTEAIILLYMKDDEPVGIMACRADESIYHVGKTANEILWHVDPGQPPNVAEELINAYEYWAKLVGCKYITLTSLEHDKVEALGRYYRRRGYKPVERAYKKEL